MHLRVRSPCVLVLLAWVASSACEDRPSPARPPRADVVEPTATVSSNIRSASLPPLTAELGLVELPLAGFGKATVAVPRGATEPRPIVVALHGHAVRPEHACVRWHEAAHGWPFVLCPLGLPRDARADQAVTLGSAEYTGREIGAGLAALRQRFGAYVGGGRPLLAAWSQGAKVGATVAELGQEFDALALGEGGYDVLDDRVAKRLGERGLRRALLLCGTRACEKTYAGAAARLRRAGVPSRVVGAGGAEHPFDGAAVEAAKVAWSWLVEGDPRFR